MSPAWQTEASQVGYVDEQVGTEGFFFTQFSLQLKCWSLEESVAGYHGCGRKKLWYKKYICTQGPLTSFPLEILTTSSSSANSSRNLSILGPFWKDPMICREQVFFQRCLFQAVANDFSCFWRRNTKPATKTVSILHHTQIKQQHVSSKQHVWFWRKNLDHL